MTDEGSGDTSKVDALVDDLLAAHDPRTTDAITFRGAQYDRGLAGSTFPRDSADSVSRGGCSATSTPVCAKRAHRP